MKTTTVGDIEMCYQIIGDGPPLVLIMGLTASMDWWDPEFLSSLSSRYRLLLFDNRGAGRTTVPPGDFTIEQFANDTAGLMDFLGIDRAHVLGMSMGGMIAQELALNHPHEVDKLVLCSTSCGGRESVLPGRDVFAILANRSGTTEEIISRFLTLLFPEKWLEQNREYLDDFIRRYQEAPISDQNAARQFMATTKFNTFDRLHLIQCPTLVACGSEDILIPAENSRILAGRIPGAELVVFDGAAHAFINQCRDEFIEVLDNFLG